MCRMDFHRVFFTIAAILSLAVLGQPRLHAQQSGARATVILHNGKILTVDAQFSTAQAVAIQGDKIAAVGDNAKILAMALWPSGLFGCNLTHPTRPTPAPIYSWKSDCRGASPAGGHHLFTRLNGNAS